VPEDVRTLKLDDGTVTAILDDLDARPEPASAKKKERRFPYRVRGVRVDFNTSRDVAESHLVITRNIGREGISFLAGNVVHVGTPCTIHLIGIQHNVQLAHAKVAECRYIQGTVCAHEVDCRFEMPVDPASFAATAIRARVLIADASPMSRRLLVHMLEPLNVELVCVGDGITAVQRALAEAFDLILIDTVLPKLDGLNAVRLLRKKGYLRPICAISSKTTAADREAALLTGCEEFLAKPARFEQIEAVVQRTRPQPLVSSLVHKPDMCPLIDDFVLELLERASKLEDAYASVDRDALREVAMALKADAGGFGFELITTAAAEVESALTSGIRLPELRPKLSRLVRLCQAARPATATYEIHDDSETEPWQATPTTDALELADSDVDLAAIGGDDSAESPQQPDS
jgi:CheY-like chemotaxis protein